MKLCKVKLTNHGKESIQAILTIIGTIVTIFSFVIGSICIFEILAKGMTTAPFNSWIMSVSIIGAIVIWSILIWSAFKNIVNDWFECTQ